ncbi:MAG: NAD-dependent epimerase/dehydratase family protein [Alphaproteobacteria bacterium]|nr:NAD-dependent epimerase/dehydratase family protein [Alphaproteobacteria bacterium]
MSKGAVLVTGANGFVGRAVCRHLRENGWPVLAAVRPGRPVPEGCEARIAPDLSPDADWRAALAGASYVIHSAARVHQMGESPELAWEAHRKANLDGTLTLARQAAEAGVKRFVFVSTAKVMGEHNPPDHPFADQDPPNPQDPYAHSKWQAEQALLALPGLETAILRPPLVYGAGATANLESLMRLIMKGVPLPFGGVDNRRSLVSASNLAHALALLLIHPAAAGKSFLVKDLDVSTPGLIRQLAQALDRPARLLFVPVGLLTWGARLLGKRDLAERVLGSLEIDDSHLRQTLGWTPAFDPAQEMARMAKAFTQDL